MRIALDGRAASHPQPGGFKTYTRNLIWGLSRVGHGHEFIVYLDRPCPVGYLPEQPNFRYVTLRNLGPLVGMPLREQLLLPYRLRRDAPDVVHYPCSSGAIVSPCPSVVTIHDTLSRIEAISWDDLGCFQRVKRGAMQGYQSVVELTVARNASLVLTDSRASCADIVRYFEISPTKIRVVPIATEQRFRPIADSALRVRDRFGLTQPFILGLVSASPRKNAVGLIEAYAALGKEWIDRYALVLVWTHGLLQQRVLKAIHTFDLQERVRFLERVSDDDLVALYGAATAFVFPSLCEGFGLPPLEAMACGTPVVASNRSSIPEVVGDAALLVDPTQPSEISAAILRLLTDSDLRSELRARGLRQAVGFSWEDTAQQVLSAYEAIGIA